ncbi:multiple epidermal growth factor-like domains protein 6 [Plakobranchus ocellatus]|uniref:Multiple epidermal growth factor-like domains protein 6 n=1 Tax=Plakobranchus ocellatus TaxID=259542 RepID=A0AAV4B9M3_9GAST|nr:multiple epidermal growth factor-like domains protein 6 [Plakobranchus ocellatus]
MIFLRNQISALGYSYKTTSQHWDFPAKPQLSTGMFLRNHISALGYSRETTTQHWDIPAKPQLSTGIFLRIHISALTGIFLRNHNSALGYSRETTTQHGDIPKKPHVSTVILLQNHNSALGYSCETTTQHWDIPAKPQLSTVIFLRNHNSALGYSCETTTQHCDIPAKPQLSTGILLQISKTFALSLGLLAHDVTNDNMMTIHHRHRETAKVMKRKLSPLDTEMIGSFDDGRDIASTPGLRGNSSRWFVTKSFRRSSHEKNQRTKRGGIFKDEHRLRRSSGNTPRLFGRGVGLLQFGASMYYSVWQKECGHCVISNRGVNYYDDLCFDNVTFCPWCNCRNKGYCDPNTAECLTNCAYGWRSRNCSLSACPHGKFAPWMNCSLDCAKPCKAGVVCHPVTGECYQAHAPSKAFSVCPRRRYGWHCMERCHCWADVACHPETGKCQNSMCARLYTGKGCFKELPAFFGQHWVHPFVILLILFFIFELGVRLNNS